MRTNNVLTGIVVVVFMGFLFSAVVVLAGNLEPSEGPTGSGSQMYTLDQIYNRINNGTAATKNTTFAEPSNGPTTGTMHTLDEIYDLAGLRAPVPKTGQNWFIPFLFPPIGSDANLIRGVAWPVPRFTDNNNGTVTDNLTGLIWLKNANCFGTKNWSDALNAANTLAAGNCGLTDGSTAGQWRLPNVKELQSLIDFAYSNPALSNAAGTAKWVEGDPFTDVHLTFYWSSTTSAGITTGFAWFVYLSGGNVNGGDKTSSQYVWPVRGGQ